MALLLDSDPVWSWRLSKVRHLARWAVHVCECVRLPRQRAISELPRLRVQQAADVCRTSDGAGCIVRHSGRRLHYHSLELAAAIGSAAARNAQLLYFVMALYK